MIDRYALKRGLLNIGVFVLVGYFALRAVQKFTQQGLAGGFFTGWGLAALAGVPIYAALATLSFKLTGTLFIGARVGFLEAAEQVGFTVVAKYLPGKLWSVAVRALLCERYALTASQSVAFSVFEMAVSITSGLIVAGACWLAIGYPTYTAPAVFGLSLASYYGYTLLVFLVRRSPRGRLSGWLKRKRLAGLEMVSPPAYLKSTFYYSLLWLGILPVLNCYLNGLQTSIGFPERMAVCAYYLAGILAGFVALFAPGGIGVREGVFVAWAGGLLGYADAAALAVLMRLWSTVYDLAFGAMAAGLYFLYDNRDVR